MRRRKKLWFGLMLLALPLIFLAGSCCPCHSPTSLGSIFTSSTGAYGNLRPPAAFENDRRQIRPGAARVRVLTYNVNYGGAAMDEGVAAIAAADADVVCLQETTHEWNVLFANALGRQYPYQHYRDYGGAGGQSILSKKPIQEIAWTDNDYGWFPSEVVLTETPVGPLQLLSVHLKPPLSETGSVTFTAYFGAGAVHAAELKQFLKSCKPGLPTVVLGDFNENDCADGVVTLEQRGFSDALPQFDRTTSTWHWETKYLNLTGRYDHVMYSSNLACLTARVIQQGQSDHYPVVAELAPIPTNESAQPLKP